MNYIRLLTDVTEKFKTDDRLNATHISIYYALFQYWNLFRFRNQFFVQREEIMQASKVGSLSTYHRCINDLNRWNYIAYLPSKNPLKGSQVKMAVFWKNRKKIKDLPQSYEGNPPEEYEIIDEQVVDAFESGDGRVDKLETTKKQAVDMPGTSDRQVTKKKGSSDEQALVCETNNIKPTKETKQTRLSPPSEDEVVKFFNQKKWSVREALKFYHHYQAIGWKIGGNTPIENWKSLAHRWMLKAGEFKNLNRKEPEDYLKTTKNKNYGEPL
ncbi:hypothetical protein LB465_03165 [Salegentibacter sp. LM13S]|uniref:hypothetical protein n=1 Tax=Salegentibacter lacus TaxID=2873599 RepID=UPI001CCAC276|nr:hypothetical protein [Salegentibacter lacus]MBZ9629767.1 hypothetical protein [Salegentibacter lacus]